MNLPNRIMIVVGCGLLCIAGAILASLSPERLTTSNEEFTFSDGIDFARGYRPVTSAELDFSQIESVILRDQTAASHQGRIEFGSVKMNGNNADVNVMFFQPDDRMVSYLYTLRPQAKSWKIARVQRLWFVPRSQLVRGLRV